MKQFLIIFVFLLAYRILASQAEDQSTVRVFIFAGQSNMVGSDSQVKNIKDFPPFEGVEEPQNNVRFSYLIGRENKAKSNGWITLQPINNIVGPELSFAKKVLVDKSRHRPPFQNRATSGGEETKMDNWKIVIDPNSLKQRV